MRKMRVIPRLIFIVTVILASACTPVDKNYVNQVIGEYKLNDADREQLIKTGISKEKIESLEKAYVLKDGQGLIMEYRDTVPLKLKPSLKNTNEFFTQDSIVDLDNVPDFQVNFIISQNNQRETKSGFRASFNNEAAKQLNIESSNGINLYYHRIESLASDKQSDEPWIRMNENTPQIDVSDLEDISNSIRSGKYGGMHSAIIIKEGYLVFEEYFNGSNSNHVHIMASATKSVTSVIIGIAVDQGLIHEDQKVVELFKDYNIKNMSEKKSKITVKNLLTMRHGLAWYQKGPPTHYDNRRMMEKDDYIQYVLDKPMRHRPGTVWNYSNGASVLLGAIIGEATAYSYKEFADKFLFNPIGITSSYLSLQDKKGHPGSGGYLKMTARDMARFGLMVLNNGQWGDKQIISTPYLQRSFKAYSDDLWWGMGYGYHWWLLPVNIQGRSSSAIKASGHGGQQIWILPKLNAVVVFTAWNPQHGFHQLLIDLFKYKVIPALEKLPVPVNKVTVSKILSEDAVYKIQFNEKEPWTGKWKVESSSQGGGIWAMIQEGKTVKSSRKSAYEFEGKVQENKLIGKVRETGIYFPLKLEMTSNGLSFTGTLDYLGRIHNLHGKRIE